MDDEGFSCRISLFCRTGNICTVYIYSGHHLNRKPTSTVVRLFKTELLLESNRFENCYFIQTLFLITWGLLYVMVLEILKTFLDIFYLTESEDVVSKRSRGWLALRGMWGRKKRNAIPKITDQEAKILNVV